MKIKVKSFEPICKKWEDICNKIDNVSQLIKGSFYSLAKFTGEIDQDSIDRLKESLPYLLKELDDRKREISKLVDIQMKYIKEMSK